jgi:hypothetical protein
LAALGVDLGDKLRGAGGKNPTGFFEDQDILALNKRLKRTLGIRGHSVCLLDDAVWESPPVRALQREAVAIIGDRFGAVPLWGYKYGRTLRLLPFWMAVLAALDMDVRYVMALRNPLSVARSRVRINPLRGRQTWSDLEWLVNVVPYFHRVRGHPLSVVDFDRLMAAPADQLARVARDLSLPLGDQEHAGIQAYAEDFVRPDMPRSRFSRTDLAADARVNRWVIEGYSLLDRVAGDELSPEDPQFWTQWMGLRDALFDLGPLLAEFDAMRTCLVRARWNPATPVAEVRQLWRDLKSR